MQSVPKIIRADSQPKPCIAFSIPEAAKSASVGTSKLRSEIRAGRLRARKLGKRTIVTAQDLEDWAAALPDIHDVPPDAAAAALKDFRVKAKHPVARAEVTEP
jgi:excisionase family DNA binding protein